MDTHLLIVTKTTNGRSTPTSVWDASNESDFVKRVPAASPRDDEAGELQNVEEAARHATLRRFAQAVLKAL